MHETTNGKREDKKCVYRIERGKILNCFMTCDTINVHGRALTHIHTHKLERASGAHTHFSQFAWHRNAASCMGSPFNSKSIVTATPNTKKTIVFPCWRSRWGARLAMRTSSNEDREFPSFHLTLCDFQLQRMWMNRNVHSYRCECSFAIHHSITFESSQHKKMVQISMWHPRRHWKREKIGKKQS